jgi:hypothetical protein
VGIQKGAGWTAKHVKESRRSKMENYTAEELLEIVGELGLPCEIAIDDDRLVSIDVELDGLDWSIELGAESPFYHSVILKAVDASEEIPHHFVNTWNEDHITSTAYVLTDPETLEPILLEDGEYVVVLRNSFPFYGSVTKEFIEFMFHCFHEDVCEFYGFTDDDEEIDEASENFDNQVNPEHAPIPLLEQLQLELTLNPIQTARSLARSLGISKYEVNHHLYMHKELFEKEGTSPPVWTNKGEND